MAGNGSSTAHTYRYLLVAGEAPRRLARFRLFNFSFCNRGRLYQVRTQAADGGGSQREADRAIPKELGDSLEEEYCDDDILDRRTRRA